MTNKKSNLLYQQNIITLKQIPSEKVLQILQVAKKMKQNLKALTYSHLLDNKIIAHCFFEPSTRTRLSFETAALRLGAKNIGFLDNKSLSTQKGENLYDTMKVISEYADLIVIRHSQEGAAALAAEVSNLPVINAGDGANQHPTQALTDLFTIHELHANLNGLSIALTGDLKYGRTIHSFIDACSLFDVRLYLVSPEALALPEEMCNQLKKRGVRFSFHHSIEEVISKIDILYMTRIQHERFTQAEYQIVKEQFILKPQMLSHVKPHLKILHPLPRVNEITVEVDSTPYAYYFQQAGNGVFIRQALLALILNEEI